MPPEETRMLPPLPVASFATPPDQMIISAPYAPIVILFATPSAITNMLLPLARFMFSIVAALDFN